VILSVYVTHFTHKMTSVACEEDLFGFIGFSVAPNENTIPLCYDLDMASVCPLKVHVLESWLLVQQYQGGGTYWKGFRSLRDPSS
jgi:hypothetical protein